MLIKFLGGLSGFNSRTLGRVRLLVNPFRLLAYQFQFTHPGKGATPRYCEYKACYDVSIHAPWEGCDLGGWSSQIDISVSIHAPWEGCDERGDLIIVGLILGFNSRTLGRVRPSLLDGVAHRGAFQFTHPGKGATVLGA